MCSNIQALSDDDAQELLTSYMAAIDGLFLWGLLSKTSVVVGKFGAQCRPTDPILESVFVRRGENALRYPREAGIVGGDWSPGYNTMRIFEWAPHIRRPFSLPVIVATIVHELCHASLGILTCDDSYVGCLLDVATNGGHGEMFWKLNQFIMETFCMVFPEVEFFQKELKIIKLSLGRVQRSN
ncbi:hypothetical protein BKA67DRAFT_530682 [Truncatella angustata]|uniref:Uncharacterized protein n=1 Tax=Truncatella angustata TaxID=152316 RepID=A0A9P8UYL3_9PEZI|nr:uncharacterized protein BKA67DRAFT_530682 [Truncatella angustata]KAH6660592.1 hypothetical protein BKA67DRAFT_530682 [Truncatella angustata]